jgi:hypothetical protein
LCGSRGDAAATAHAGRDGLGNSTSTFTTTTTTTTTITGRQAQSH